MTVMGGGRGEREREREREREGGRERGGEGKSGRSDICGCVLIRCDKRE